MKIDKCIVIRFMFLAIIYFRLVSLSAQNKFYDVREFGAKGDGATSDTKAINEAIEKAAASGGGTVYFPAGNYLTGSVRLESNICLYIDQGAILTASSDVKEFDRPEPTLNDAYQDFGHSHWHNSLIWGDGLHDISIIGAGEIQGKGLVSSGGKGDIKPNKSIALVNCRNVIIRDVTIAHGGWFAILATGVDNMTLDNLKVDTNRDGFDIDCCRNVHVSNCFVNSPRDDGICLKSSFALGYARPTENVSITNCHVSGYDEGTFLNGTYGKQSADDPKISPVGRIKFGTESNGGFKNITINNCVFDYCRGLALETVDGALLEDVTISNITMRDVRNAPIFIRLGSRMRGPDSLNIGKCRRVIIQNVVAWNVDSRSGVIISGVPGHCVEDIELSNIKLYYRGGGVKDSMYHVVPELLGDYPEPSVWGIMPSYGFFIRHARNIQLNNIDVHYETADGRPAFMLDDVNHAKLLNIEAAASDSQSAMILKNVSDIDVSRVNGIKDRSIEKAVSEHL